jgi:hypothetical protein
MSTVPDSLDSRERECRARIREAKQIRRFLLERGDRVSRVDIREVQRTIRHWQARLRECLRTQIALWDPEWDAYRWVPTDFDLAEPPTLAQGEPTATNGVPVAPVAGGSPESVLEPFPETTDAWWSRVYGNATPDEVDAYHRDMETFSRAEVLARAAIDWTDHYDRHMA